MVYEEIYRQGMDDWVDLEMDNEAISKGSPDVSLLEQQVEGYVDEKHNYSVCISTGRYLNCQRVE
jgi:hypothetical protein